MDKSKNKKTQLKTCASVKKLATGGGESSLMNNTSNKEFDLSKRKYLVGLNLFNRKPDKGIAYLIEEKFLDKNAKSIAEFLYNRNCLSKQMIGEYISNTQDKFVASILT